MVLSDFGLDSRQVPLAAGVVPPEPSGSPQEYLQLDFKCCRNAPMRRMLMYGSCSGTMNPSLQEPLI